ncbi:hypothetical protein AMK16_03965 [Streptomyces sp. CB00455]|nr:hypothetical protein AMK16_03965 [Streptomyces sp. CB00455]
MRVPAVASSVAFAVASSVAPSVASSVAFGGAPSAVVDLTVVVIAAVMSATRSATVTAAGSHRDHCGDGRAVAGTGRRVSAAISHGRRGGQCRPQQDRDRQQAPGTGFVHPGSMGPHAPAHPQVRPGSPERVECRP